MVLCVVLIWDSVSFEFMLEDYMREWRDHSRRDVLGGSGLPGPAVLVVWMWKILHSVASMAESFFYAPQISSGVGIAVDSMR